jgi:hypothetical protein
MPERIFASSSLKSGPAVDGSGLAATALAGVERLGGTAAVGTLAAVA